MMTLNEWLYGNWLHIFITKIIELDFIKKLSCLKISRGFKISQFLKNYKQLEDDRNN